MLLRINRMRMGNREATVRKIMKEHHGWIKGRKKNCTHRLTPERSTRGITVHYFRDPRDNYYVEKKEACESAIELVSKKFQLPTNMFVYCTTQRDSAAYVSSVSVRGKAVRDPMLKEGGYVFLGDTSIKYSPMQKGTEKLVRGGVIDGTKSNSAARVVADQKYEEFKTKGRNEALAAKAVAACVHELGHILHQMDWKSAYYDCMELRNSVVDGKVYDEASRKVSDYAYTETTRPYEFVAETFCGLVCGFGYPQLAIDLYNILDGPGKSFSIDTKGVDKKYMVKLK